MSEFHSIGSFDSGGFHSIPRGQDEAFTRMAPKRTCEDCGDETETRRQRCKHCKKLVCNWCIGHVHGLQSWKDTRTDG